MSGSACFVVLGTVWEQNTDKRDLLKSCATERLEKRRRNGPPVILPKEEGTILMLRRVGDIERGLATKTDLARRPDQIRRPKAYLQQADEKAVDEPVQEVG
jgi:hypothetical protein